MGPKRFKDASESIDLILKREGLPSVHGYGESVLSAKSDPSSEIDDLMNRYRVAISNFKLFLARVIEAEEVHDSQIENLLNGFKGIISRYSRVFAKMDMPIKEPNYAEVRYEMSDAKERNDALEQLEQIARSASILSEFPPGKDHEIDFESQHPMTAFANIQKADPHYNDPRSSIYAKETPLADIAAGLGRINETGDFEPIPQNDADLHVRDVNDNDSALPKMNPYWDSELTSDEELVIVEKPEIFVNTDTARKTTEDVKESVDIHTDTDNEEGLDPHHDPELQEQGWEIVDKEDIPVDPERQKKELESIYKQNKNISEPTNPKKLIIGDREKHLEQMRQSYPAAEQWESMNPVQQDTSNQKVKKSKKPKFVDLSDDEGIKSGDNSSEVQAQRNQRDENNKIFSSTRGTDKSFPPVHGNPIKGTELDVN